MAITYAIVTGRDMLSAVAGVPQIFNNSDTLLTPIPGLIGNGRPSRTLLTLYVTGVDPQSEVDDKVQFSVYVPQPLDVSDGAFLALPKWMPILTVHPMTTNAADSPNVQPLFSNDGAFPDPATRLLDLVFEVSGGAGLPGDFMLTVNFKHSIF